jgi:hypothetical protein
MIQLYKHLPWFYTFLLFKALDFQELFYETFSTFFQRVKLSEVIVYKHFCSEFLFNAVSRLNTILSYTQTLLEERLCFGWNQLGCYVCFRDGSDSIPSSFFKDVES